jgi:exopolysaccharide biosynthesis polyprenyl glycosylphosphotransferase
MPFGSEQTTTYQTTPYMSGASHAGGLEIDGLQFEHPRRSGAIEHPRRSGASRCARAHADRVDSGSRRSQRQTVRRALVCGDIVGLILALGLYELLWSGLGAHGLGSLMLAAATIAVTVVTAQLLGLYDRDLKSLDHTTTDEIFTIFQAVTLSAWLGLAAGFLIHSHLGDPRGIVILWVLAMMLMLCARVVARAVARHRSHPQRTLIVGSGEVGQWVAQKLLRNPRLRLQLVGFVDGRPRKRQLQANDLPVLGGSERLGELVRSHAVERVIVAFSGDSDAQTLRAIRELSSEDVQIDIVPRLFETLGLGTGLHLLEGLPLIALTPSLPSMRALALKRAIDVTMAVAALVALLPLMVAIAIGVKLDSPGPVLYLGERVGRNGKRFRLCKFRTMHLHACRGKGYGAAQAEALFAQIMSDPARREEFQRIRKLREDPRVTRFGALLRRTSLDELPQLLNVLRGDLSLIGPRPVTAYEYDQLDTALNGSPAGSDTLNGSPMGSDTLNGSPAGSDTLNGSPMGSDTMNGSPAGSDAASLYIPAGYWEHDSIRPGMTGYWQVMARSNVSYEERLRLDLTYMTSWSLKLDMLIAVRTLGVLAGHGAY